MDRTGASSSRVRTRGRVTKRGRGNTSRPQPVESIAGFETVIFNSEEQRERFGVLMDEPFSATRWLSSDAMSELGLREVMAELFAGTGFVTMLGMDYLTYRSITLEFLSSFEMNADATPLTLSFRVLNNDYTVSLADFATHLGLVQFSQRIQAPDSFDPKITWNCMSRTDLVRFGKVRVNDIEHPALRLWFRTLGGTYFGRPEVGTLTRLELCILGRHLNVQRQATWGLHIPFLVAKHMVDVATSKLKTIRIGGIITCLIRNMGISIPADQIPVEWETKYIDLEFLRTHHHWYLPAGERHRWSVGRSPQRWMTLPCNRLPHIFPLPAGNPGRHVPQISYLIPMDLVYAVDEDMPPAPQEDLIPEPSVSRRRPRPHRVDTTQAGPSYAPPPPTDQSYYVDHFHYLRQQFTQASVNQQLVSLPQYHRDVQSGDAQAPYATYYRGSADPTGIFEEAHIDPSTWGANYGDRYGGFGGHLLDQFGRFNLGQNDDDDGNDEDDDVSDSDEF